MRDGIQFGPYSRPDCEVMLMRRQLLPSDLAWQPGMAEWRPIGELVGYVPQVSQTPSPTRPTGTGPAPGVEDDETVGQLVGQMGCGCVLWIGLLILALGGGVIFPVLLILLPIALIGGIIDMVRKIIRLVNRPR
jgi:hypothetical protein